MRRRRFRRLRARERWAGQIPRRAVCRRRRNRGMDKDERRRLFVTGQILVTRVMAIRPRRVMAETAFDTRAVTTRVSIIKSIREVNPEV